MKNIKRKKQSDEPHTVVLSFSGEGKETTETYYYGDAKAPSLVNSAYRGLRMTKGASMDEMQADCTLMHRVKSLVKRV